MTECSTLRVPMSLEVIATVVHDHSQLQKMQKLNFCKEEGAKAFAEGNGNAFPASLPWQTIFLNFLSQCSAAMCVAMRQHSGGKVVGDRAVPRYKSPSPAVVPTLQHLIFLIPTLAPTPSLLGPHLKSTWNVSSFGRPKAVSLVRTEIQLNQASP